MITRQANVSVAANTAGMGAALTSTGASYVITAAGAADGLSHQITIKNNSVTNHSGKTVLITGTDENDRPLTETHAMPGSSVSVTSVKFFKTVTSIVPSATTGADTFDIGWTDASQGAWIWPTMEVGTAPFRIGVGCTVASGTPTYTVKYTQDSVGWFDLPPFSGKTVSTAAVLDFPCAAVRMEFAAAGGVTLSVNQSAKA